MTHKERAERRAAIRDKLANGATVLDVATEFKMAPDYVRQISKHGNPTKARPRGNGKYVVTMSHPARTERRAIVSKFIHDGGTMEEAKEKFNVSESYVYRVSPNCRNGQIRGSVLAIYADLVNSTAIAGIAWKHNVTMLYVRKIERLAKSLGLLGGVA